MASGAGVVTGGPTTAFNPAGLHPNTVAPYGKDVTADASNVSAFVVDGEILNSGQDAASRLARNMLVFSGESQLPFMSPIRLTPLIVGARLSKVPTQVGSRTTLPAENGSNAPDIVSRHLMDAVINSLEQEKKKDQTTLRQSLQQNRRGNTWS